MRASALPELLECLLIAGQDADYQLKVALNYLNGVAPPKSQSGQRQVRAEPPAP